MSSQDTFLGQNYFKISQNELKWTPGELPSLNPRFPSGVKWSRVKGFIYLCISCRSQIIMDLCFPIQGYSLTAMICPLLAPGRFSEG